MHHWQTDCASSIQHKRRREWRPAYVQIDRTVHKHLIPAPKLKLLFTSCNSQTIGSRQVNWRTSKIITIDRGAGPALVFGIIDQTASLAYRIYAQRSILVISGIAIQPATTGDRALPHRHRFTLSVTSVNDKESSTQTFTTALVSRAMRGHPSAPSPSNVSVQRVVVSHATNR